MQFWRQTNHEYPDNRSGHIFYGHGRGARHRLCRDERIAAVFANRAQPKTLNRATGIILVILGVVVMGFNWLS